MANQPYLHPEKSIAEVLRDMKSEALDFVNTRYELLAAELKEKTSAWKKSLPMLIAATVFALGTFATLTFTLVSLLCAVIRVAFPENAVAAFAWPISAFVICVIYGCTAVGVGRTTYKRLTAQSLAPERTLRVLKQDQQWLKEETRAA